MRTRDFHRWVVLRMRFYEGHLWIAYEDEIGTRRPIPRYRAGEPIPAGWVQTAGTMSGGPQPAVVPQDLESLLESGVADIQETRYHQSSDGVGVEVPWLLPVFVAPPPGLEALPWEALLRGIVPPVGIPARCVLVRLARTSWKPRPALRLPLTVLEASGTGRDWLEDVRARPWYADSPAVQTYGLRLARVEKEPARGAREPAAHVVLLGLGSAERRFQALQRMDPARARPRLFVVLNETSVDEALSRLLTQLPEGSSLLILQWPGATLPGSLDAAAPGLAKELLYGLVHDFALHEVVWILGRQFAGLEAFLASDPAANQDLRMARTMRRMVDDALEQSHPFMGGEVGPLLNRLPPGLADAVGTALSDARPAWERIAAYNLDANRFAFDFSRESRGMAPMAQFLERARVLPAAARDLTNRMAALAGDPKRLAQLARHQARRADMALEEYDAFGVLRPLDAYKRHVPLRAGWRYRLRVHIGQRGESSLVEGDVPAIDPLLPMIRKEDRHEIDVVVYEKSFALLSPRSQTLRLP